jgi:hypothetical protein
MLVASAALVVVGAASLVPRIVALRRRARLVEAHLVEARTHLAAAWERIEEDRLEMDELLRPWRLTWKWVSHPLTRGLIRWAGDRVRG